MPWAAAIAAVGAGYAANRQNAASKDATKAQSGQNEAERQFILQQTGQARDDASQIYGGQAQNTMMGGQAALDILRGALPQQAGLFNQGQNNAMSAILGGEITPFAQPDFSFIPQAIPQYTNYKPAPVMGPQQLASALGGNTGKESILDKTPSWAKSSLTKKIEKKSPARKALKKLF